MAFILTFLGKGGTGRTTMAIAAAKKLAAAGKRVLLASQGGDPAVNILLGTPVGTEPTAIADNLQAVRFETAQLLESGWEQLKKLEAEYLRNPFFKEVYGQELDVFPGMDAAFAANELREYDEGGKYDVLVYDSSNDVETLRMLAMPESISWYLRRFGKVIQDSDIGRALSPFVQPVSQAVLSVDWSRDNFAEPTNRVNRMLDEGKNTISDPTQVAAFLVTTADPVAVSVAKYRWGSAQQVGVTVGGVLANQVERPELLESEFAAIAVSEVPVKVEDNWGPVEAAMPDFMAAAASAPRPIEVNVRDRQVRLFLPGFDKKQVKLTQYGPEVTVEAGDRRRNIFLPPELRGQPVKGAKFQDRYLIVSF